ncbi:alpha/beta fold hydrolase [Halalkalicoccus salilacus]|uniref:alpha/beta fold hydrolase n=1 Tax=Halalkalicoccus salilacus TaxID=3117459 RepID=UPI00300F6A10
MPSLTYDEWTEAQDWTTVPVDDHDLHVAYYEEGEGEGDPVVFLHGIPTCSYLWAEVVPRIAEERRVIVPDMVGYGESSMDDGFDRSIRAQEEMIDGLLEELGIDSCTFVGHDLGGGVGLRLAARRPKRVDRLVLSNAVAYDSWPIETIVQLGLPETADTTNVGELRELLEGMMTDTLADPERSEWFLEGMKAQWSSEEAVVSLVRNAAATNTNHTTEIDPEEIEAPTLLLWGADDEFQPIEYAERLNDDIPDSELVGIEGARHWVPVDRPEEYGDRLAAFLLDGYEVSAEGS